MTMKKKTPFRFRYGSISQVATYSKNKNIFIFITTIIIALLFTLNNFNRSSTNTFSKKKEILLEKDLVLPPLEMHNDSENTNEEQLDTTQKNIINTQSDSLYRLRQAGGIKAFEYTDPIQKSNHENQQTNISTASVIPHLTYTLAQGTIIPGILETAINSELPGFVKAIVSSTVYASHGATVLIPKGSHLIGQYHSMVQQGQNRVFVEWIRIITSTGLSINLNSPGADSLGQAGMEGNIVDRHFFERFSQASLLSLIGAGTATIRVNDQTQHNSASSYRTAIANSFQQSANASFQSGHTIKPTIHVWQGTKINVLCNKDISFYDAMVKR